MKRTNSAFSVPLISTDSHLHLVLLLRNGCPGLGKAARACGRQFDRWWLPNGIIVVHVIISIKMTTWLRSRHEARGLGIISIIGPDLLIHWRSNFLNFWRGFALPCEWCYYAEWLRQTDDATGGMTIDRCRNMPLMGMVVVEFFFCVHRITYSLILTN